MSKKLLSLTSTTVVLALGLTVAGSANATAILRADFDPSAHTYGLAGAVTNATTTTNGEVTLVNGVVRTTTAGNIVAPAYYDGNDASVIRINFSNPVSAFGLDWISFKSNPTLSVFDSSNNLLESLTLDWTAFPVATAASYPYGFIGLNEGANSIAYATIDTPLNGNELFVDNLIYQTAAVSVPEPASLSLLAIGAALLRRKQANQSVK